MTALRRLARPLIAAAAALGLLAGCGAPQSAGPSAGAAAQFEQRQAQNLVAEMRRKNLLVEDPRLMGYIGGITRKIEAQRPDGVPPLQVHLVRDADVNAFTPGAGYVFFNAGMLAALENESQFAMVLAHEAAHVDLGHVAQGAQARRSAGVGAALAQIGLMALGAPAELAQAGVGLGAQAYVADFTRDQETEADAAGFRYHAAAGYDSAAGAESFSVLRRLYGDRDALSQFFATHPQSAERRELLQRMAAREGRSGGRVGEAEWLRATEELRRQAHRHYVQAGRRPEARQTAALLDRTR